MATRKFTITFVAVIISLGQCWTREWQEQKQGGRLEAATVAGHKMIESSIKGRSSVGGKKGSDSGDIIVVKHT